MKKPVTIALVVAICASSAAAADWPQWQGAERNAVSDEKGLLQKWPADGPPLTWRIDGLGGGDSSPAIVDGKIYGMSNRNGDEIVWALSEKDGGELWATPLGDAIEQGPSQSKEGPACTPTVDGDRLYVIGMGGRVACLDLSDGKVVWMRSMTEDFGGTLPMWSYRESPLIDGEQLICTPGSSEALLVALNKQTGETLWKTPSESDSSESQENASPEPRPQPQQRPQASERGETPERPMRGDPNSIAGTEDAELFRSEHWGMTGFAQSVANGNYVVNLFFAETFQGITDEAQRVFSFTVEGKAFKNFDPWAKAGGPRRAYTESVPVEVSDGELTIEFTSQVENPAIKAIEILPQSGTDGEAIRINAGASDTIKDSRGNEWLADRGFKDGSTNPGTFNFAGGPPRGFGGFGGGGRPGFGGGGFGRGPRSGAAYSSAIAIDFEGEHQYVQLTADALIGVRASDGKLLWRYAAPANAMGINCSTPLYQDGVVFAASAYGAGGGAVKLARKDDGSIEANEVFFSTRMQNHHGGMIVVDQTLYGANGGNGGGMLSALDFETGDVLWRDRAAPKGALLYADNRIYLRGEEGEIVLVEPSREEFIEHGRFEQPDRTSSPAWARPLIANGRLYIRDQSQLFCYDIQTK